MSPGLDWTGLESQNIVSIFFTLILLILADWRLLFSRLQQTTAETQKSFASSTYIRNVGCHSTTSSKAGTFYSISRDSKGGGHYRSANGSH